MHLVFFLLRCLPVELVMEAHGSSRCLKNLTGIASFACMTIFGENLPTIGLSAGWVPATVADYNGTVDVLVKLHGSFDDPVGDGSRIASQSFDENSQRPCDRLDGLADCSRGRSRILKEKWPGAFRPKPHRQEDLIIRCSGWPTASCLFVDEYCGSTETSVHLNKTNKWMSSDCGN